MSEASSLTILCFTVDSFELFYPIFIFDFEWWCGRNVRVHLSIGCSRYRKDQGKSWDHENGNYKLFPFVDNCGVEVFIRKDIVGLFSLYIHDLNTAGILYNRLGGGPGIFGNV